MRKRARKLGVFHRLVLLANAGVIVILCLSYLAPVVNPQHFWPIAFFGIAYWPVLLINVLFVCYWLFFRRLYALASLMVILIGWGHLRWHIGFHKEPTAEMVAERDTAAIRLLTYNVHLFRSFDENHPVDYVDHQQHIISLLERLSPDVICFQEFFTRRKGKKAVIPVVKQRLNMPYYYFYPSSENDYEGFGVAIFSRFPIQAHGYIPHPRGGTSTLMIYTDLLRNGNVFRVYNVHLRSIGFQAEDYQFINNARNAESEVSATKRIGQRLKWAFSDRGEEALSLRNHADSCGVPYMIAGDFNDTPMSYAVNQVAKGMVNSFREKGSGWGVTYNGDFPNFQIDYIFVSPHFNVKHYQIVPEKYSDHYPVWGDFVFSQP